MVPLVRTLFVVLWSSSHVMGTACTHKDVDMVTETDAWLVPDDCTELTLAGRGVDDEGATKLAVASGGGVPQQRGVHLARHRAPSPQPADEARPVARGSCPEGREGLASPVANHLRHGRRAEAAVAQTPSEPRRPPPTCECM